MESLYGLVLQSRRAPGRFSRSYASRDGYLPYIHSKLFEVMMLFLTANFFSGVAILMFSGVFSQFIVHLVCLTVVMYITVWVGAKFLLTMDEVRENLCNGIGEGTALINSLYKKIHRKSNLIPCFAILVFFFWGIFSQAYIVIDIVGIYAVFLVTVSVSASVIGYVVYLWLLWFIYRLSQSDLLQEWASEAIPAKAPALVLLAELTNAAKLCFFIEGFIYIFQYFILIPHRNNQSTLFIDNPSFMLTWIALLIVIVLGFPAVVLFQERCLSRTVDSVKQKKLTNLKEKYGLVVNDIALSFYYESMMNNVLKSDDYPIKIRRLGAVAVSAATFIIHFYTLISQMPDFKEALKLFNLL